MFATIGLILAQSNPSTPLDHSTPDPSAIPLNGFIVNLTHGLEWVALILALVGLLVSAGVWAAGAYSNNFQQTFNGKRGVAISAVAAVVIGFAPVLLNLLFSSGSNAPTK
jgi:hypothetical protein